MRDNISVSKIALALSKVPFIIEAVSLPSLLRQFMAFGVPSASYVPIMITACGMNHAFGSKFFLF